MQTPLQPRYRCLDLWRGVACLMVVVCHTALYVPGARDWAYWGIYRFLRFGYLGVPLFFVISGYCIAATSDAHRRSKRPAWVFMQRRIRRVYPPFWIMVACLSALLLGAQYIGSNVFRRMPTPLADLSELRPLDWLGNLTLSETWLHHLLGQPANFVNAVSWSLCYEEQFYLICFLTILFARRYFFRVVLGITAAVTVTWAAMTACSWQQHFSGTFIDIGWWEFACGVGVYWRLNYVADASAARRLDRVAFGALAVLIAICAVLAVRCSITDSYFVNPWLGLVVAMSFAVALVILRKRDDLIAGSRWGAMLAGVGGFSYSLYLTHLPVCKLVHFFMFRVGFWTPARALVVTLPISIMAAIFVGWAFGRVIEQRFLNPSLSAAGAASSQKMRTREGEVSGSPESIPAEAAACLS